MLNNEKLVVGILLIILFNNSANGFAQNYNDSINHFRNHYKYELAHGDRAPLKRRQTRHVNFYKPDTTWRILAEFSRITDTIGFDMMTSKGITKRYYVYGKASFTRNYKKYTLFIYQSEKLRQLKEYENHLFLPFQDETNGSESFGGGRYLDLKQSDIQQGQRIWLDFNFCYNPYCAFKGGYACPVPPVENRLAIAVRAGEKNYSGKQRLSNH